MQLVAVVMGQVTHRRRVSHAQEPATQSEVTLVESSWQVSHSGNLMVLQWGPRTGGCCAHNWGACSNAQCMPSFVPHPRPNQHGQPFQTEGGKQTLVLLKTDAISASFTFQRRPSEDYVDPVKVDLGEQAPQASWTTPLHKWPADTEEDHLVTGVRPWKS